MLRGGHYAQKSILILQFHSSDGLARTGTIVVLEKAHQSYSAFSWSRLCCLRHFGDHNGNSNQSRGGCEMSNGHMAYLHQPGSSFFDGAEAYDDYMNTVGILRQRLEWRGEWKCTTLKAGTRGENRCPSNISVNR